MSDLPDLRERREMSGLLDHKEYRAMSDRQGQRAHKESKVYKAMSDLQARKVFKVSKGYRAIQDQLDLQEMLDLLDPKAFKVMRDQLDRKDHKGM